MAVRSCFQIAIQHEGLGKQRVIRGADRFLVEAAAASQRRAWDEQYAKELNATERRREREDRKAELADNLREADVRTRAAQAALEELRGILAATLRGDDRIHWDHFKQHQPFSQPAPQARAYLPLPPEPQADDDFNTPRESVLFRFISARLLRSPRNRRTRLRRNAAHFPCPSCASTTAGSPRAGARCIANSAPRSSPTTAQSSLTSHPVQW